MPKLTNTIKSLLKMFDLFPVTQFIRYKGEPEYTSATGGFCSVTILTIFAILFTNLAIKTVNRQIITWTSQTIHQIQPTSTIVQTSPAPFLFTVGIMGLNLNDPTKRWFDFTLTERKYKAGGIEIGNRSIQLVPCTQQHFAITDNLKSNYRKVPAKKWLCPPLGYSFEVSGKFTSSFMNYLDLSVYKCNPALNSSRPCATSTEVQNKQAAMGQFSLSQFFINPLLNPGSEKYIDYYLQDRNYIAFTSNFGAYSNIHIQDYKIITDESILPFAISKMESGVIIPELFQNINFEVNSDFLAALYFYKSSSSTTYNRQFYKIDSFFSYVGGLVGVIMGVMMLLSSYNQLSFEVSLSYDLFHKQHDSSDSQFSIISFIQLFFYSLLKSIFKKLQKREALQQYEVIKQQMAKQLDISVILRRLLFLQRSIEIIFQNGQFQAMHLTKKISIDRAKMLRHYYSIRELFQKRKISINKVANPSLNITQNQLKLSSKEITSEYHEQQEGNSDDSQLEEQLTLNIKHSIKSFKNSLKKGDIRSERIDKEIDWGLLQTQYQKIDSNQKHSQNKSIKHENDEQELADQNFQKRIIKPKAQETELQHFQFINNVQSLQ